jgi:hypothetical protein
MKEQNGAHDGMALTRALIMKEQNGAHDGMALTRAYRG